VLLRRTSFVKGRPSIAIAESNSLEIFKDDKSREVKPFKLTKELMKCGVIDLTILRLPGSNERSKDKDVNVGLSHIARAMPLMVIQLQLKIIASLRNLQFLNKWKSDRSFM
jgi:hypothetical protein